MYIKDISKRITEKCFVDDTKMNFFFIKEDSDVGKLQGKLDKLFIWQDNNNMLFNGSKFQLLRYGPGEELNNNTLYFTENTDQVIERHSSVTHLGLILSNNMKIKYKKFLNGWLDL